MADSAVVVVLVVAAVVVVVAAVCPNIIAAKTYETGSLPKAPICASKCHSARNAWRLVGEGEGREGGRGILPWARLVVRE